MTEAGDTSLAELITREQRGFRTILLAGLVTLLVMLLTSAALGYYLYTASQSLERTTLDLQRQTFDMRRRLDFARNRIASQERDMRRIYEEIRGGAIIAAPTPQNIAAATEASRQYLLRGRVPTLAEERLIRALSILPAGSVPAAPQGLFKGVIAVMDFDASEEDVDGRELPPRLAEAVAAFEAARSDPALTTLAAAGVGGVRFRVASADRRSYREDACKAVLAEVQASVPDGVPSPQPLFWRAQCRRMSGAVAESLPDYARAVRDSAAAVAADHQDPAELGLAVNAFHGLGIALIASADLPDTNPAIVDAIATARQACPRERGAAAGGAARMQLAAACLERAAALRDSLQQTQQQAARSREYIGFALLRNEDYRGAYENAAEVEEDALFQRNELIRALAASRVRYDDDADQRQATAAAVEARRNLTFFRARQFNMCELQTLMKPAIYEAARALVAATHPGEEVACARR